MNVKQLIGYLLQNYELEDKIGGYNYYGDWQEIEWDNIDSIISKWRDNDE